MSQPSIAFNGAASDAFLPSMKQEHYTQAQLDKLFGQPSPDQPVFSTTNSEVLDDLDFNFDDVSLSHANSFNASTISTPDFASYNFGQQASTYPSHPSATSPHPYPLEHQQTYLQPPRPLPIRAHTNSTFLVPSQPPQGYIRRRSLSHNDAVRIPNPTFVRLQTPRARSTTPEEKRRAGPYPRDGRSASQGPGPRGRPLKNVGNLPQESPLGVPMTPIGTTIGTPLNEMGNRSMYFPDRHMGMNVQYQRHEDLIVQHMTSPTHLAHSRRIIQIGAMAVRHHVPDRNLDPRLRTHESMLKKLDDVEDHLRLQDAENEEALKGCAIIKEALKKRVVTIPDSLIEENGLDKPSAVMKDGEELFGGCYDDNELMSMLIEENKRVGEDDGDDEE
jgi:hypothetical protein